MSVPDYVHMLFKAAPKGIFGTTTDLVIRPGIICKNNTRLSVQASSFHHCLPRKSGLDKYTHVEVMIYGKDEDPEPNVPVEWVNNFIHENGGPEYVYYGNLQALFPLNKDTLDPPKRIS